MMINPECYVMMNLEGKSQEEVLKNIKSTRRRIKSLKTIMEDPEYKVTIYPPESTQLIWTREYLKKSIEYYEKIGGKYKPTRNEQKAINFNNKLPSITKLTFNFCGLFLGCFEYIYEIDNDEKVYRTINNMSGICVDKLDKNGNIIPLDTHKYFMKKKKLIEGIREMDIGEWKNYFTEKYGIESNNEVSWDLKIDFSEGEKSFTSSGKNVFPYNFKDFISFFKIKDLL